MGAMAMAILWASSIDKSSTPVIICMVVLLPAPLCPGIRLFCKGIKRTYENPNEGDSRQRAGQWESCVVSKPAQHHIDLVLVHRHVQPWRWNWLLSLRNASAFSGCMSCTTQHYKGISNFIQQNGQTQWNPGGNMADQSKIITLGQLIAWHYLNAMMATSPHFT